MDEDKIKEELRRLRTRVEYTWHRASTTVDDFVTNATRGTPYEHYPDAVKELAANARSQIVDSESWRTVAELPFWQQYGDDLLALPQRMGDRLNNTRIALTSKELSASLYFGTAVASCVGGAMLFVGNLGVACHVSRILRIASVTPVLASVYGCGAVVASGAVASGSVYATLNYTSTTDHRYVEEGPFFHSTAARLMTYGLLTCMVFVGPARAKFRHICPSSVTWPGVFTRQTLKATGPEYATGAERVKMQEWGKTDGCHSCGRFSIFPRHQFIADHMPPNKYASGRPQWFHPQCRPCSQRQASAVANDRRALITHATSLRWWKVLPAIPATFLAFLESFVESVGVNMCTIFQHSTFGHHNTGLASLIEPR